MFEKKKMTRRVGPHYGDMLCETNSKINRNLGENIPDTGNDTT